MSTHLATGAGRERDQPIMKALEQLPVDPRLTIEALELRDRDELHQVLVALLVIG